MLIRKGGANKTPSGDQQKRDETLDAANRVVSRSRGKRQVLDELPEGHYSKMIAYAIAISVRTVEVHRAHMLDRLGVRITTEAVRLATLARMVTQA